jgi:hypothetical protein
MNWYAAHLVMYVRLKGTPQDRYPIWENVVLVKADSEEKAFTQAECRGREDAGDDDGSFRWGGVAATWVFAGVRKLTLCQDANSRPGNGTEVTFIEMEAASLDAIEKLVSGKPVSMRIADRFRSATPQRQPG